MLCEYLSLHVQLCAIYRSHVRRHHPQPQLPTRPPLARILPPERQGQESHPGQSLPLACRPHRGPAPPAARRIRPGRRPVAGPSTGTGLWTALRAPTDGRRAGHRGGAGSQSAGEAGFVPGVGPCGPSGLSAVRWAEDQAVGEVLGLGKFDEDDLYAALDDLAARQERMEKALYRRYRARRGQPPRLFLYDVTSSYLEGEKNELGEYGYNRDGKRGKLQIVIGLLADEEGEPLAVRVFEGHRSDPTTVVEQIKILQEQFGVSELVFV